MDLIAEEVAHRREMNWPSSFQMYPEIIMLPPTAGREGCVVIADVSVAAGLLMPSLEVALRMDASRFHLDI